MVKRKGAYMEAKEKLSLLQDLFDIDWADTDLSLDVVRYVEGVVKDEPTDWVDDDPFIDMLMDEFTDDHLVWQYIRLE